MSNPVQSSSEMGSDLAPVTQMILDANHREILSRMPLLARPVARMAWGPLLAVLIPILIPIIIDLFARVFGRNLTMGQMHTVAMNPSPMVKAYLEAQR